MDRDGEIARRLFGDNVLPACATAAALVTSSLVDAAVTGQCLGKTAVAAFGLTNPILFGVMGLSGMLGAGTVLRLGQAFGRGDRDGARPILPTALAAGAAAGTLILLFLLLFPARIAAAMGAGPGLLEPAADYLRGYAFGVPAFFLQFILGFVMPLDGDRNRVAAAMIVSTAVNVTLDLLNGFVFRGGLYGMALATSASNWAAFGVLALHFRRREKLLRLSLRPFRAQVLGGVARDGAPYALQLLLRMLCIILVNRIILAVSPTDAVAVFSLLMSASNLVLIDGQAVTAAVLTVENYFAGEEDGRSVTALMRTALRHGLAVNLGLAGLFALAAPALLRLFTVDGTIYGPAVRAFRLFVTCAPFYAVCGAFRSHLQCIRHSGYAMVFAFFDVLACPAAAAFCLSRLAGIDAVWLFQTVGEVLTLAGLAAFCALRGRRLPTRLSDCLLLDPAWEDAGGPRKVLTVRYGPDALARAAEAAGETLRFAAANGADPRQANLLGVCAEELCTNVVRHGFRRPRHALELSVERRGGVWRLRVRDNCAHFDVSDWFAIQEARQDAVGLGLVRGLAQDVRYMSALKLNSVEIRIPA